MKQTIKLKESQLKQLVTETIKKVLKEQDESDLRYELHKLIGDEMRKEKRASMYGASRHEEEYQEAKNKVKMFLNSNPSMRQYVDAIEDHFEKQLYQ